MLFSHRLTQIFTDDIFLKKSVFHLSESVAEKQNVQATNKSNINHEYTPKGVSVPFLFQSFEFRSFDIVSNLDIRISDFFVKR